MIKTIEELKEMIRFASETKGLASLKVSDSGEVIMNFDTRPAENSFPGAGSIPRLPRTPGQLLNTETGETSRAPDETPDWEKDDWYRETSGPVADAAAAYLKANGGSPDISPGTDYVEAAEPDDG